MLNKDILLTSVILTQIDLTFHISQLFIFYLASKWNPFCLHIDLFVLIMNVTKVVLTYNKHSI
jgi:hypothetical protein